MRSITCRIFWLSLLALVPGLTQADESRPGETERKLVLVTADGLRWQEVFRGADEALLNKKDGGVADVEGLRRQFWRDDAQGRREALMPFLWTVLAKQGQLYGNTDQGSQAKVTNGKNFSYPGYNELLTGAADPRIDSNDLRPNPNVNVLEWLNRKPAYKGKVAAFSSWDAGPFILNRERSGLFLNGGWEAMPGDDLSAVQIEHNRKVGKGSFRWPDCRDDEVTFPLALDYLRQSKPKVLYIMYGDTDEHAHHGRYDLVLDAVHQFDADLKQLWETLQSIPEYRGQTSLLITTDHGRGDAPQGWKNHGADVKGAEHIWIGVLGPWTPPLGERKNVSEVTQSQIAATAAALLGEDYRSEFPKAAEPIANAVRP
ncbi:MAG: alkaline phosphatase family protein [Isosphaeraceae bacterium]